MNACRRVYGPTGLVIPARLATRRTTRAAPCRPLFVRAGEDRSLGALSNGQVDRPRGAWRERDGDNLAALAGDNQGSVPAFEVQVLDAGAGGFGHPEPVERQQGDQRVLGR
jgi:hypothetical protein